MEMASSPVRKREEEDGLKDCECDDSCCEDCWNEEEGEDV